MRRALLAAVLLLPAAGRAQPAEELAFWDSVRGMDSPAAYRAYLNAYPTGSFAALARLRLDAPPVPGLGSVPATVAAPTVAEAPVWMHLAQATVRVTDGVVLDLDAAPLRTGSNHRLLVMPAAAPEGVADPQSFAEDSTPIPARRVHVTIPAGPPGQDEVRLYYIPQFASAYTLAARAPLTVLPGAPGAVLARDLHREAAQLGPLRFEAKHRDRPVLVQAAFLRVRPRTEWNVRWFGGGLQEVPSRAAVISIGLPGAVPDGTGSLGEVICVLPADAPDMLDRIAALNTGDPVLVRGIPTMWDGAESGPLLLARCSLTG